MEFERVRDSALARRSASVAHAPLAPTATVASITQPLASVIQPLASVIHHGSVTQPLASVIQPASVIYPAPVTQPLASVIQPVSVIQPASVTPTVEPPLRLVPISATHQADSGQVGGAKTQKRIEFEETDCRLVFRKALLCKTFTLRMSMRTSTQFSTPFAR